MSSQQQSNGNHDDSQHTLSRLCHVIKRDDFDGYGFNLHAEKGKPGQYIGKVDDNSPAELAGLRQGDRIIEVNSVNIGNETHKQVVQRIKAIACEVRLLVVDPNLVSVTNENHIVETSASNGGSISMVTKEVITTQTSHTSDIVSSNGSGNGTMTNYDRQITNNVDDLPTPPPPPSAISINASGIITSSDTYDGSQMKTKPENGSNANITSSQNNYVSDNSTTRPVSVGQQPNATATAAATGEGLNLRMTAAELRAKLAAKKKYDPKTDTVDLRKKYEIVQKL